MVIQDKQYKLKSVAAWNETTQRLKHYRSVLRRVVSNWLRRESAFVILRWQAQVCKMRNIRKVSSKLITQGLCVALYRWEQQVKVRHRYIAIMGRVGSRWIKDVMWEGWQRWNQHHEHNMQFDIVCSKAMLRWAAGLLTAVFSKWKCLRENLEFGTAYGLIVFMSDMTSKQITKKTSAALCIWADHVCDLQSQRHTIKQILGRWILLTVASTMARWRELVHNVCTMRKAASKLVKQSLCAAICTWEYHVVTRRGYQAIVRKVQSRWMKGAMWAGWRGWSEQHAWSVQYRQLAMTVAGRWTHGTLTHAFWRWGENYSHAKVHKRKAFKHIMRWMLASLNAALEAWARHRVQRRRNRRVVLKIGSGWRNRVLLGAWGTWTDDLRHARLACKIMARWRQQLMRRAFLSWAIRFEKSRCENAVRRRACTRWANQSVARAWSNWHHQSQIMTRLRRSSKTIVHRWINGALSSAWLCWVGVVDTQRYKSTRLSGMIYAWTKMILLKAMHKWSEEAATMRLYKT